MSAKRDNSVRGTEGHSHEEYTEDISAALNDGLRDRDSPENNPDATHDLDHADRYRNLARHTREASGRIGTSG